MRLNGKIAIVTGAASGIGRAISELFAEEGAVVYATDIVFPEKSAQLKNIIRIQHDVSDEDQWRALVARVESEQGRLSVLVNNAGIVGSYDPHRLCFHGDLSAGRRCQSARTLLWDPNLCSPDEEEWRWFHR